jgi:3-isopropylmalate/(R)-2-methylmalate dehydratase large subunit
VAGLTITEKIFAKAVGKDRVVPGEVVNAGVESIMILEALGSLPFRLFDQLGVAGFKNPDSVVAVWDHLVPCHDVRSAERSKEFRRAVHDHGVGHYYDIGRHGIGHQIMVEKGYVLPGTVCVGTDSHATTYGALGAVSFGVSTTDAAVIMATGEAWFRVPESAKFHIVGMLRNGVMSKDVILYILGMTKWNGQMIYKAVELGGPTIEEMSISSRMVMCNMVAEMGAKNGIIAPDERTIAYLKGLTDKPYELLKSDADARYDSVHEIDVSDLPPQVARPHSVDNVCGVDQVEGTSIDEAFLGSCTNGRVEDLEIACRILKGRKVHPRVRMIVVPASQDVYLEADRKGLIANLIEAGASVNTPSCAACAGFHTGILASGEVAISSTNRNTEGRMGSPEAEVYLASPATVAASAVAGVISDPRRFL